MLTDYERVINHLHCYWDICALLEMQIEKKKRWTKRNIHFKTIPVKHNIISSLEILTIMACAATHNHCIIHSLTCTLQLVWGIFQLLLKTLSCGSNDLVRIVRRRAPFNLENKRLHVERDFLPKVITSNPDTSSVSFLVLTPLRPPMRRAFLTLFWHLLPKISVCKQSKYLLFTHQ